MEWLRSLCLDEKQHLSPAFQHTSPATAVDWAVDLTNVATSCTSKQRGGEWRGSFVTMLELNVSNWANTIYYQSQQYGFEDCYWNFPQWFVQEIKCTSNVRIINGVTFTLVQCVAKTFSKHLASLVMPDLQSVQEVLNKCKKLHLLKTKPWSEYYLKWALPANRKPSTVFSTWRERSTSFPFFVSVPDTTKCFMLLAEITQLTN